MDRGRRGGSAVLYFVCSSGSHSPSEDKDEDEDDKRRKMDTSGHGGNSKRKLNTHQISTIQFFIPKAKYSCVAESSWIHADDMGVIQGS